MWDDKIHPADEAQFKRFAATARTHDFKTLGEWFAQCLTMHQQKGHRRNGARIALTAIVAEWGKRKHELLPAENRDRPELGVLRGIGYSVGAKGREENTRQLLVNYLMTGTTLPPIKDLGYMAEWGGHRTAQRYHKAHRTFEWFAKEYFGSDLHTRAVGNWIDDLNYLEKQWSFLSGRPAEPWIE